MYGKNASIFLTEVSCDVIASIKLQRPELIAKAPLHSDHMLLPLTKMAPVATTVSSQVEGFASYTGAVFPQPGLLRADNTARAGIRSIGLKSIVEIPNWAG